MAYSYKTAIAFGLVYVPITLHTCIKNNDITFNNLYKKTGQRIKYNKTCDNCPSNIHQSDIMKGYQYEKDKYVTLTSEELELLKTKKDKTIEIECFVNLDEIDPVYFDKSYYINPTGAENAFVLILKALDEYKKVGIAKTVLGTKEQLVAIRAIGGQLILNTMHFYDEIQTSPLKNITDKVTAKELSLAKLIIENMTEKFAPQNYKNEYRERLLKAIDGKLDGKSIEGKRAIVKPHNVINLMEALQKSVNVKKQKAKSKSKKSTAKKDDGKVIPFSKNA